MIEYIIMLRIFISTLTNAFYQCGKEIQIRQLRPKIFKLNFNLKVLFLLNCLRPTILTNPSKFIFLTWDNFLGQPQRLGLLSGAESSLSPAPKEASWSPPHLPPWWSEKQDICFWLACLTMVDFQNLNQNISLIKSSHLKFQCDIHVKV